MTLGRLGIGFARAGGRRTGTAFLNVAEQVDSDFISAAQGTYTFTMDFGAVAPAGQTRTLIAAFSYRAATAITISSVTIGGVSAAVQVESRNTTSALTAAFIASANVPNGTSGDVAVTFSGNASRCGVSLFRALNLESAAAYLTGTGTRGTGAGTMAGALSNYRERGIAIGAAYSAAGAANRHSTALDTMLDLFQTGVSYTVTVGDGTTDWSGGTIAETTDTTMNTGSSVVQAVAVAGFRYADKTRTNPTEILAVNRVNPPGFSAIGDSNGTDTGSNSRISMFNEVGCGITKLKAHFCNAKLTGTHEANGANTINFRAAIEYPAGTFTELLFSGVRDVTLTAGSFVSSDELTLTIPEDTQFWARTYITVNSGQVWPRGYVINGTRGEACDTGTGTSDLTTSGTITGSASAYGPFAVTATGFSSIATNMAIATIGDSIVAGSGDGNFGSRGETGWNGRGAFNFAPHFTIAVGGTKAQDQVGNFSLRLEMLRRAKVTHVIFEWGINDLSAGRTSAQVLADLQSLWNAANAEGWKVIQTTPTPRSTGSWGSLAAQTATLTTHRPGVVSSIRAIPAPLFDVIDMALVTEATGGDAGKWLVNAGWTDPSYTGDGLHPNVTNVGSRQGGHYPMADAFFAKIKEWR